MLPGAVAGVSIAALAGGYLVYRVCILLKWLMLLLLIVNGWLVERLFLPRRKFASSFIVIFQTLMTFFFFSFLLSHTSSIQIGTSTGWYKNRVLNDYNQRLSDLDRQVRFLNAERETVVQKIQELSKGKNWAGFCIDALLFVKKKGIKEIERKRKNWKKGKRKRKTVKTKQLEDKLRSCSTTFWWLTSSDVISNAV
jgi:hypothetical protein